MITVYSKERGLRTLKEGVTLESYRQKWPSAIEVEKPTIAQLEEWTFDSICETPDGCQVEPDGTCAHGYPSWLLIYNLI